MAIDQQSISIEDFLARAKPARQSVFVNPDLQLAERYAEAKDAVSAATAGSTEFKKAEKVLASLKTEVDEVRVEFTLQSIGRDRYQEILEQNPPSESQLERAKQGGIDDLDHNPDTFQPALVAASLVSPSWTEDEVVRLWKDKRIHQSQLNELYATALIINTRAPAIDWGKG